MLRNRLYYGLKPLIPASARMAIRRWFAVRKREQVRNSWPILPGSEVPPANWQGWPDGKQFALVLTHDVEGPAGLEKCRRLMKLEQELGFRSSFNFIPEGPYKVPQSLREELVQNGFEVGVHDLNHDGKLFRNKTEFSRKAARINQHLKEWNATGFRSGFMLRNREWLHELNVAYDASTFDTDPFEPQPDGVGTIFPFWVPAPSPLRAGERMAEGQVRCSAFPTSDLRPQTSDPRPPTSDLRSQTSDSTGYLELPYTLPQDSTLFLLFREKGPDLWLQKLDWIARHGGMALLNVHPDYLRFEDEAPSSKTFPVEFYVQFLKQLREKYSGQFWHALPREVARHVAASKPAAPRRPLRVCMVTHSHYARDNRVIRYAEALAARGDEVDVLGLRPTPESPDYEKIRGVNVFCLQDRFGKKGQGAFSYLWPILRFFFRSSIWMTKRHHRQPYDVCHIHNIPDFLVFAAWYPRLRGARIVLDIHDIVPEFFASKFSKQQESQPPRSLLIMERWSARFADRVIIANDLWLEKYSTRTGANGKCSVFINNVDTDVFRPIARTRDDGKFILIFPGGLQWHQGLDIAIRAFHKVAPQIPEAEFHIYGDGNMKESLVELAKELGLSDRVRFFKPLPIREVATAMANADLGVVPKRADSFGNEAYSTKIMEFMAVGIPVIVSSTKIDRFYFNDSVVRFFESGNVDELAKAILDVRDANARNALVACASVYVRQNSWETRKSDYLKLVDSLITSA